MLLAGSLLGRSCNNYNFSTASYSESNMAIEDGSEISK
jgi:hypothetical protein